MLVGAAGIAGAERNGVPGLRIGKASRELEGVRAGRDDIILAAVDKPAERIVGVIDPGQPVAPVEPEKVAETSDG